MAVVMVAMLAFGGTYAYFTAQATAATKTATTGKVMLSANSIATLVQDVVPTQDLLNGGKVQVTSSSTVKTFVFVEFKATLSSDPTGANLVTSAGEMTEGKYMLTPTTTGWTQLDGTNVYYQVVDGKAEDQVLDVCTKLVFDGTSTSNNTTKGSLMSETITVTIDSSAIQYEGFNDIGEGKTYADEKAAATAAYAKATITEPTGE